MSGNSIHTLDWAHAFKHRLGSISHERSAYAAKLPAIADRLVAEISSGLLPCLDLPFDEDLERRLGELEKGLHRFKHMMVLGIGGSALGARALQKAFFPAQDRPGHEGPWLWIADNIDVDTFEAWLQALPPDQTVVVAISKSGGTIETMSQYFLAKGWLAKALGPAWKEHVILVTDEKSGQLRAEAERERLVSLPVPDNLGGRYSVISAVGMLPAAFTGMDWRGLLRGAWSVNATLSMAKTGEDMVEALKEHPSWRLAVWARELMENGYSELIFFCYVPLWNYFGAWFSQLWAESLGKDGKGSMPVPAVGVTDQHSVNQMFLDGPRNKGCLFITCPDLEKGPVFGPETPEAWSYLRGKHFGDLLQAEGLGTRMALAARQVPLVHCALGASDEEAAGRFMGMCMAATVMTGWLMDINPLDQPAVELGKRLANARLGAPGYEDEHRDLDAFLATEEDPEKTQQF